MPFAIRPFTSADYDQWQSLWQAYLDFYQSKLPDSITQNTWQRLLDHPAMHGFGAYDGTGNMLGFAHIILHPYTWHSNECVYLEDLFVHANARRQGIARTLIEAVYAYAATNGYPRVYWLTAEHNHDARHLYRQVADQTGMIQFRKNIEIKTLKI